MFAINVEAIVGVIADQIYGHLDQQELLPEKQKRSRKRSRGSNDLLYIVRAVIREVKARKNNLAMTWCHIQGLKCLDLVGVAENIKTLLVNIMEKWRVMLCAGNSELGKVDIK